MSDRPMRLKYLTKMKIILCIFLLCITAVSVFGKSVELNGIEGKSIEFKHAVETDGNLMYSSQVLGRVLRGALIPLTTPEYQGRVQWDSNTGLFSLSGLRLEDSGVYTVEKDYGQKSVSTFSLTVWIRVSKPSITIPHIEHPCSILCTAERGTGVNLTLYRAGDTKRYSSSDSLDAPYLDMTVPVESGTYTCEAKNSVSRQTSDPLTVGGHCTDTTIWILLAVVVYFLFAAVAYFLRRRFCPPASSSTGISAIIFAVVALFIAVVFAVLYGPPAKPTIWIVIAFFVFLLFAAVAYFLWRRFCHTKSDLEGIRSELEVTKSELEVTKSELEVTKSELEGIRSKLKGTKSELEVDALYKELTNSSAHDEQVALQDGTKSELEGSKTVWRFDALYKALTNSSAHGNKSKRPDGSDMSDRK